MLKETEIEETIDFFVTFLSLVAFRLEGAGFPGSLSGYAYALRLEVIYETIYKTTACWLKLTKDLLPVC